MSLYPTLPQYEPHVDATDRAIHQDDYIAYAVTSGRSAVLKFGKVKLLRHRDLHYNKFPAVVECITYDPGMMELQKGGRLISLGVRCIVVIPGDSLPQKALDLITAAEQP